MGLVSSCGVIPEKIVTKSQIIDLIISDDKNPRIKEIALGGREHSKYEMFGNIKVRSTNGHLKVKTNSIIDWWTSIEDEKTFEMDRVEKIVHNLRIKERVKFISSHLDKDYNSKISQEVQEIIDGKITKSKSNVVIRDEIGLFAFFNQDVLSEMTHHIENNICKNSAVAMSKHSDRFNNNNVLIRIASGHNGAGKYKQFYTPNAEKEYLIAIEQFRSNLINNYIGTHFDISKHCHEKFKFDLGKNSKANVFIQTPDSKRSILFDKAKDEVFQINARVKDIDFTGGFVPGKQYHENDFIATTGKGVIRVQNISADVIKLRSITLFFNKNANESTYNASILPGQYLDFEIEENKKSKVFSVKNYAGGTINGGINIGYDLGGQMIDKFINIDIHESSIWNDFIITGGKE